MIQQHQKNIKCFVYVFGCDIYRVVLCKIMNAEIFHTHEKAPKTKPIADKLSVFISCMAKSLCTMHRQEHE